jgi:hypothetical protein
MRRHLQTILAVTLVAAVCGCGCVAIISSHDRCRDYDDDECSDCHGGVVVVEYKNAPPDSTDAGAVVTDSLPEASVAY